jgi:hypothetical protein
MLYGLPISISFTSSFYVLYLAKGTSCEAPHYAIFFNFLSFRPSSVQIFSSAPCSQIPSVYVPSLMLETKFRTHTEPQSDQCKMKYLLPALMYTMPPFVYLCWEVTTYQRPPLCCGFYRTPNSRLRSGRLSVSCINTQCLQVSDPRSYVTSNWLLGNIGDWLLLTITAVPYVSLRSTTCFLLFLNIGLRSGYETIYTIF